MFDYDKFLKQAQEVGPKLHMARNQKYLLTDLFANYRMISNIIPNNNKGLRLTLLGVSVLKELKYENWSVQNKTGKLLPWQKVIIDKYMEWPYYIGKSDKIITLFSEMDYLDIKMFDGNLKLWCEAKKY